MSTKHKKHVENFLRISKHVLILSHREAVRLHCNAVGTNHLLLGLLQEDNSFAAQALKMQGVDLKKAFAEIVQLTATEQWDHILMNGILELTTQGTGSLQNKHALPGGAAVYVPQAMIEQYDLKVGDDIFALVHTPKDVLQEENYELLCITAINSVNVSTLPVPEKSLVKGSIGLSAQAKHAIELGVEEAKRFKYWHVGLEHMLLGLICEEQGLAAPILRLLGVDAEQTRTSIFYVYSQSKGYRLGKILRRLKDWTTTKSR